MSTSKSNATAPAILSIRDSKGEVPQGGATADTSVIVEGRAEPGRRLEVFDGTLLKGEMYVGAPGNWSMHLGRLENGPHSITASVDGAVSNARTFSVRPQ